MDEAEKYEIITFFTENHFKEIRNTFFHSAYSLSDDEYHLHDSDPITIKDGRQYSFNVETFLYPKIESVISFFNTFKGMYLESFDSYKTDKEVHGLFPNPSKIILLGSEDGLKGFKIKDAVQFYGKSHDSGIWYEKEHDMWAGQNIEIYFANIETIEIGEQLSRYEKKAEINLNNAEFVNLVDKVKERNNPQELIRAVNLLAKFGQAKESKMNSEQNEYKKKSYLKFILPYYKKAVELGDNISDLTSLKDRIKELEK